MADHAAGQLDTVERATVYDAIAFTPPAGDIKNWPIHPAWFDVVVLVETASPGVAGEVRAAAVYQALTGTLTEYARRVHQSPLATCAGSAMWTRAARACSCSTTFAGDNFDLAVELWDYLAGWYEAETGLENSTLLGPIEGEESDYVMINHARWDHSLPLFMACQLPKRTLPQLHAGQPESPPPQRHARPVPSGLTRSPERWQGTHPGGDQPLKLPGYDDPSHQGRSGNCPNDPGASPERARGARPPVLAPHVNPLRGDSGMPQVDCISAHRVWPVAG
jgi:hypothetical protein